MIKIALVDDHKLFRRGLINLIELVSKDFEIAFEANNGKEMITLFSETNRLPEIILMDVNMPEMDGYECVAWLAQHHPNIKILVVSMIQSEESIIKMLRLGVKGYLSKDVEPAELLTALNAVYEKGYYYTDFVTGHLIHSIKNPGMEKGQTTKIIADFSDRELVFIRLACTEMTYNEIAEKMFVSPKTIDGYRKVLFEKLNIKTRVALALFAVKNNIVQL